MAGLGGWTPLLLVQSVYGLWDGILQSPGPPADARGPCPAQVTNMPLQSSTTRAPLLIQQAVAPYQTALPALEQLKSCISYG
ncbi:TPA: hypothetical protein ACH3X2_010221, partial [Trebouxia sp. C0005]